MGKKRWILFSLGILVVFAAVLVRTALATRPSPVEPAYDGKPLSFWLVQLTDAPTNGDTYREAHTAVRAIGTNSFPILLQMLRAHDSPLKTRLLTWASDIRILRFRYTNPVVNHRAMAAFFVLGPDGAGAVPELSKILDQKISLGSENCTALSLGYIGPDAKAAVPALLRSAGGANPQTRALAVMALKMIDPVAYAKGLSNAAPASSP
jgi:hypothetical protein